MVSLHNLERNWNCVRQRKMLRKAVMSNAPRNLRILHKAQWPLGIGPHYRGAVIQFGGDPRCNDYRLFARSFPVHGHQPLIDDPTGWPRRRTWTQIGGYDAGSGQSRTQANTPISVTVSDLPDHGPWQLMIELRTDHTGKSHSNAVIWDPNHND